MSLARKIRRALRGDVSLGTATREAARRARAAFARVGERASLSFGVNKEDGARLLPEFARMSPTELLAHFRSRESPRFLPGFASAAAASPDVRESFARTHREQFPSETARLIEDAGEIVDSHRWPLLGYGAREFGAEVDWLRDPLTGARWPLDYHARIDYTRRRGDGSDLRVLWELNRLAHLSALGRAYALTDDARLAKEFFAQIESWRAQNPVGFGPNWSCAMEVALRATNLLAAFELFRRAPELDESRLIFLLALFDEHGAHIKRNLEFSFITTSNHYLSDVVGLFWLGTCLPELRAARGWREFGLREMLREMDKQILPDGAHSEASTGYHRLVLEMFLYSFVLARTNDIRIEDRDTQKLRAMLEYVRAYLRPDGRAPLVGDTDGGQFLPVSPREADDHAYILAVGTACFDEPRFKITDAAAPPELLWMLGARGVETYARQQTQKDSSSQAYPHGGTYLMREGDLFLLFNASGAGLAGRGSHGHNDALSVEVSAGGASLLADPGTYVYTSDLRERHLFRSTAYHSTVEVDGEEQNTTDESEPFIIGDEARPRVLRWETDEERDLVVAEHDGYKRFPRAPQVTHRRAVLFDKRERFWIVRDELSGADGSTTEHDFRFRFHAAPGARVDILSDAAVEVCAKISAVGGAVVEEAATKVGEGSARAGGESVARLFIVPLDTNARAPEIEPRWSSRHYGAKEKSLAACWTIRARAPLAVTWALVPVGAGEDERARLELIARLKTDAPGLVSNFFQN